MFEGCGAEPSVPGGAGGDVGALPPEGASDRAGGVGDALAMLSGMVPGAALAGVVERAVAPLLAPAPADGGLRVPDLPGPVLPMSGSSGSSWIQVSRL